MNSIGDLIFGVIIFAVILLPIVYSADRINRRWGYRWGHVGGRWQFYQGVDVPWYIIWLIIVAVVAVLALNSYDPQPQPTLREYREQRMQQELMQEEMGEQ
jgi:heme/copper-type cytochrome/quinol oxidase subunit 2